MKVGAVMFGFVACLCLASCSRTDTRPVSRDVSVVSGDGVSAEAR